jgi:hypothetical protein
VFMLVNGLGGGHSQSACPPEHGPEISGALAPPPAGCLLWKYTHFEGITRLEIISSPPQDTQTRTRFLLT